MYNEIDENFEGVVVKPLRLGPLPSTSWGNR